MAKEVLGSRALKGPAGLTWSHHFFFIEIIWVYYGLTWSWHFLRTLHGLWKLTWKVCYLACPEWQNVLMVKLQEDDGLIIVHFVILVWLDGYGHSRIQPINNGYATKTVEIPDLKLWPVYESLGFSRSGNNARISGSQSRWGYFLGRPYVGHIAPRDYILMPYAGYRNVIIRYYVVVSNFSWSEGSAL